MGPSTQSTGLVGPLPGHSCVSQCSLATDREDALREDDRAEDLLLHFPSAHPSEEADFAEERTEEADVPHRF